MDTHLTTLQAAEGPIRDAGFAIRSGWMTSPTAGGQSWLAHGTLGSGLWTSDNAFRSRSRVSHSDDYACDHSGLARKQRDGI